MANTIDTIKGIVSQDQDTVTEALNAVKNSYANRKKWLKVCLLFFIFLGFLASFTTNNEYQGNVVVLPELGSSSTPSLSANIAGLSSLLGVTSSGSQTGGFGPDLYQEIIESQPFLSELVTTKFAGITKTKDSITLLSYFKEGEHRNVVSASFAFVKEIPDNIQALFTRSSSLASVNEIDFIKKEITPALLRANEVPPIVQIDGAKMNVMNIVKNRVKIEMKGREITISVKMPEPILSAEVCKLVLEKLIEYVSTYKTAKQRDNLAFLQQTKAEAELKYKQAQQNVAGFKDNSMGVIFQSVQTREQVLQNEMNLAFSVYNQFAMQVEQAKIELKKESPIFSTLNPIEIPSSKSEPIVWKIVFKYFSIGIIMCLMILIADLTNILPSRK